MRKQWQISRRTVLRGLGTAVALPFLEAMKPALVLAGASGRPSPPKRMAFLFVPNGVHVPDWTPKDLGRGYQLPFILNPLNKVKDDILVLSGLTHGQGRENGDGAGDHARACAAFLTGAQPRKTHGANIRVGVSVDQIAAQKIGHHTRFPSLELGCEPGANAGNCDSGYSCAYNSNISWMSPTTPVGKEVNPRLVFERLFSDEATGQVAKNLAERNRYRASILDLVAEDAHSLQAKLGRADQRKLDEYLTAVRQIERRVTHADHQSHDLTDVSKPSGVPETYEGHIRLMSDMLILAFQGDLTRVATFMFGNAGSNRSYPSIGVRDGHHDISHHGGDPIKHDKIRQINRFHVIQLAYLLERLKSIKEDDGSTLLDNCMIMYGSGLSDGNSHNHENLPVLLAGKGGGAFQTGRHVQYERETPMNNLFLSMLDTVDAPTASLGDSTGLLGQLA